MSCAARVPANACSRTSSNKPVSSVRISASSCARNGSTRSSDASDGKRRFTYSTGSKSAASSSSPSPLRTCKIQEYVARTGQQGTGDVTMHAADHHHRSMALTLPTHQTDNIFHFITQVLRKEALARRRRRHVPAVEPLVLFSSLANVLSLGVPDAEHRQVGRRIVYVQCEASRDGRSAACGGSCGALHCQVFETNGNVSRPTVLCTCSRRSEARCPWKI